jgi:hypothetical protein
VIFQAAEKTTKVINRFIFACAIGGNIAKKSIVDCPRCWRRTFSLTLSLMTAKPHCHATAAMSSLVLSMAGAMAAPDGALLFHQNCSACHHRLAFGKDGSFYVGKTALSWAGSNGIMRVRWQGKPFFAIERIRAPRGGFAVRFTEEINEATLPSLRVKRHTYQATSNYGGSKIDESNLTPSDVKLAGDKRTVTFNGGELKEHYLYEINASALKDNDGDELLGKKAWYFVAKSPD